MKTRRNYNSAVHPLQFGRSINSFKKTARSWIRAGAILTGLMTIIFFQTQAQDLDVPYVPTPNDVVEKMLDLADVGSGDYVIDLGSGDGRIVIAAAKRGAVGHGVDLNPTRVAEAKENAEDEGMTDRVMFLEENIFETDFTDASVVTMYLLSSVNEKLRPTLLENLRPGTRVVSHSFDMGDWKPDEALQFENRNIYYWVIPAKVGEHWQWETNGEQFTMEAKQEYQEINVKINAGNRSFTTQEATLKGKRINLIANDEENGTRYIYSGLVENDRINGIVQVHGENSHHIEKWSATLNQQ